MSHFPRDIHRRLDAECPCFPGTCRGDVVNGRNVIGQRCKAQKPAAVEQIGGDYVKDIQHLAQITGAQIATAELAYKRNERDFNDALHALHGWGYLGASPIDMVLHCPVCGAQHIDAPDHPYYGGKSDGNGFTPRWDNPPHRSHLCHECGHIWRPADVPTNGVAEIWTKGKNDSPMPDFSTKTEAQGYALEAIWQLCPELKCRDDDRVLLTAAQLESALRQTGWRPPGEWEQGKKEHANTLYVQAYNEDGTPVVMHSRSTSTAVEDCRIMSSALELAQAVTLRDVQISEADFYDLVIYGRNRQEQPNMAAERLPDEPAEFTAWWAREYAENSKVFHGSRAGYLKAWRDGRNQATATLLNGLHVLMGYVEDGSSTVVRLSQDDATKTYVVNVGSRQYYGENLGAAIEQAIKAEKS